MPIGAERAVVPKSGRSPSGWFAPWAGLAIAASGVVAWAAVRGIWRGYVPLDDDAIIEVRAWDVFSRNLPWLGSSSSASTAATVVHHPGPLLFDLLALPVRVLPRGIGVAVGAAGLNIAAVWAACWAVRRAAGGSVAVVVGAVMCALLWSLGSEALYEVWQPIIAIVPFFAVLVTAWCWASGRDEAAVLLVVAVSFVVQTHGSYVLLGPAVLVTAAVLRGLGPDRPALRWRAVGGGAAVGLVLWMQPLWDQVARTHNITRLVSLVADGADGPPLGLADALRAAATVLVRPPWWLGSSVSTALANDGGLVRTARGREFDPDWPATPVAAIGLIALVTLLIWVGVTGWRRRDRVLLAGGTVAVAALGAAVVTLARLPIDEFGFTAHKARWLWPLGAFVTAVLFVAPVRRGVVTDLQRARQAALVIGAVASVATIPTTTRLVSPAQFLVDAQPAARRLRRAAGQLEGRGVVFLDTAGRPFPDPYNDTLAAAMARRGIEFRVDGRYLVAQYGVRRRLAGDDGATVTARVLLGAQVLDPPVGYEIVYLDDSGPQALALAVADGVVRFRPAGQPDQDGQGDPAG